MAKRTEEMQKLPPEIEKLTEDLRKKKRKKRTKRKRKRVYILYILFFIIIYNLYIEIARKFLFDILHCMRLLYRHKLYITHARESESLDRMREPSAESVTKYSQRMPP